MRAFRLSARRTIGTLVLLAGCSCGGAATTPAASTTPPPPSASTAPPSTATTSTATTYTVHEWGLVRSGPRDSLSVGAIGPHAPSLAELGAIEKPVLYFHLDGAGPLDVNVGVGAGEGEIREIWPTLATRSTDGDGVVREILWGGARLDGSGACPLPTLSDPTVTPCEGLEPGEVCESRELARALAPNVACIVFTPTTAPELRVPFLFYRARTRALTVPLAPAYLDFDDINVRNDGDLPLPGRLIRFQRIMASVRALVIDPPAPHETILVGHDFGGPEVARAALTQSLTDIGLTADEAAAFLASWDGSFFGAAAAEDLVEHERSGAVEEIPAAPEDSILYFLPEADVDRLAHLALDPPAREVHRAMAVWTTIGR